MYYRKQQEKQRWNHLMKNMNPGYPRPVYYDEDAKCIVRYWKSEGKHSSWSFHKKQSRKASRRYCKKNDVYTKKAYDLWWNVW